MTRFELPPEIDEVVNHFMTCEFTTLGKGNVPIAWPTLPTYLPDRGQFLVASPVALSQKAANVRRDPRVSLLYSNPTGSGLASPPAVLIQGQAYAPDQIFTGIAGLDPALVEQLARQGRRLMGTQPGMRLYLANPLTRYIMEWYFIRVFIFVTPCRFTWWEGGDFARAPHHLDLEVSYVA